MKKSILLFLCVYLCIQCTSESYLANDAGFSEEFGSDNYNEIVENQFVKVQDEAVSTFSIDADGASYANIRRYIMQDGKKPPRNAIRTEELINYFDLDYPFNNSEDPIDIHGEVSACPWNDEHKLVRIGIQGEPIAPQDLPPSNFVFLIDVSGSMSSSDRLPLLKEGFKQMVDEMNESDRISLVTYAGSSKVVLESTSVSDSNKGTIKSKIDDLDAGGGTAGSKGITTAYEIAEDNFITDGNNRIIVASDGNFNIGISDQDKLIELIEEKRESNIFLSIIGVGRGYNDASLEQIANHGNGTFEYIDNQKQLLKVFIHEYNKFFAVAKDVKVQVEFNAANVDAYRLIGYENRLLNQEDFEDDSKDAGEIGADQNITALYEIKPNYNPDFKKVPTFDIDFRYKKPDSDISKLMNLEIYDKGNSFELSSDHQRFIASVASFSMLLFNSDFVGDSDFDTVISWLDKVNLADPYGYKAEFKEIVEFAE